jgi:hypothetical protein
MAAQHGRGIGRGRSARRARIRQRRIEGEAELPGEFARGATEVIEATQAATLMLDRRILNVPWGL